MAQARRSSADRSIPTSNGAHNPSEGQPTEAQASTDRSTKPQARKPAKDPAAASRKPRGAAASASRAEKAAPGAPFPQTLAATGLDTLSPALASSQAPALVSNTPGVPHGEPWRSLPTPSQRFRGWLASHGSDDDAFASLLDFLMDEGGQSLLAFCKANGFTYSSLWTWVNDPKQPERFDSYARLRAERAFAMADDVVAIADEKPVIRTINPDTGEITEQIDNAAIQRNRLRVDARKWHTAKMNAMVFGEKVAIGGAADLPAIQQAVEHRITFVGLPGSAALPLVQEVTDAMPARLEGGEA